jgi:hypothetical protein
MQPNDGGDAISFADLPFAQILIGSQYRRFLARVCLLLREVLQVPVHVVIRNDNRLDVHVILILILIRR